MRTEIELYLGDEMVEFNANPKILFNYKITDNTNPTAIKNSFSKTITVNGTAKNNEIFGNIWDLSRIQDYEGDIRTGFNPIKKTPFTIYVDGNIYESGYCKLNTVTKKNNSIQYEISLFGGIGELFFNLQFKDEEGNEKKTLADLQFEKVNTNGELEEVIDMGFTINKETVFDAWKQIMGDGNAVTDATKVDRPNNYLYSNKWNFINFIPAYEGIPADFDSKKFILNKNGLNVNIWSDNEGYSSVNGYIMGESNEELTCNETCDYRSYLQRPIIKLSEVIKACQNPINNGGWELILDEEFFNDRNPYWTDTWLTLPMLRDCVNGGGTTIISECTITPTENKHYYDIDVDIEPLSQYSNIDISINTIWNNTTNTTKNNLYLSYYYDGAGGTAWSEVCRYYKYNGAILLQLLGLNSVGEVIATSNVQYLYSPQAGLGTAWDKFKQHFVDIDGIKANGVDYHAGNFITDEKGKYVWSNDGSNPTAINFRFKEQTNIQNVKLKVMTPAIYSYKYGDILTIAKSKNKVVTGNPYIFENYYVNSKEQDNLNEALEKGKLVYGTIGNNIVNAELELEDYTNYYSNTKIRPKDYLTTEHSACDYLTAFAKLFGLYFYRDVSATPSDVKYSKGVIYLLTRNNFYHKNNIIDIESIVDRSRNLKITPSLSTVKWLSFNTEQVESEAEDEYKTTYGREYGSQLINTGFNFNGDTKDLLDKVVYKGGIEVLETSKYYAWWVATEPPYMRNGFKYWLYKEVDGKLQTKEKNVIIEPIPTAAINKKGWVRTDVFPKLQFHNKNNEPVEGENVIVFFKGNSYDDEVENYGEGYYITDDLEEMVALNNGGACWITTVNEKNTNGNYIAYHLTALPKFGRNIIDSAGFIQHSLDMGNPNMTYIRETFNTEEMGIYNKCWRNYISDMYDVNNRVVSCYVRFENKPTGDMLRNLYWFDNSLWRLNIITDWNIAVIEPVKVEFMKIIDMDNYIVDSITNNSSTYFTLALPQKSYTVDDKGNETRYYEIDDKQQEVIGSIFTNGTNWILGDNVTVEIDNGRVETIPYNSIMIPRNTTGTGNEVKTFTIPNNIYYYNRTFKFVIKDENGIEHRCYLVQSKRKDRTISVGSTIINYISNGGTKMVSVVFNERENDVPTIKVNGNWIVAKFGEWEGDKGTLTIQVNPNNGVNRQGTISLSDPQGIAKSVNIIIYQEGMFVDTLTTTPDLYTLEGYNYEEVISVNTSYNWYATTTEDWIVINNIDTTDNYIYFTVLENYTGQFRTGYIEVVAENGLTALVEINQEPLPEL